MGFLYVKVSYLKSQINKYSTILYYTFFIPNSSRNMTENDIIPENDIT